MLFGHYFLQYLLWCFTSISWYLPSCHRFIAHEPCALQTVLRFSRILPPKCLDYLVPPYCGVQSRIFSCQCYISAITCMMQFSHLIFGSGLLYYVNYEVYYRSYLEETFGVTLRTSIIVSTNSGSTNRVSLWISEALSLCYTMYSYSIYYRNKLGLGAKESERHTLR